MKLRVKFFAVYVGIAACVVPNALWGIPKLNLGLSSFLDGGPLRPEAGWYWSEVFNYYHANRFYDADGALIPSSPRLDSTTLVTQFIYQGKREVLYAHPGIAGGISLYPHVAVTKNPYGITSSGGGVGDLGLGIFLQFKPVMHKGRGILVHRIECDVVFPTGTYRPGFLINPGNNIYVLNPYWAGTLFFTQDWAASWRFNYNWSSRNKKTGVQFGDVIYLNYTMEFQAAPRFWVGMNGYIMRELKNSTLNDVPIPDTREKIFGIGPGALYSPRKGVNFFANLYFESKAKMRPAGISAVFRLLYQF